MGADKDPPFYLRTEALAARAAVGLPHGFGVLRGVAVLNAVVARQVRAGLGRRDDVIRGQRMVRVRQRNVFHLDPERH